MSWLKYISYSLVALLVASNIIVSHKLIKTTKEAPSLHTSVYKYELETYAFSTILMSHSALYEFMCSIGQKVMLSSDYACMLIPPSVCNVCLKEQTEMFIAHIQRTDAKGLVIVPQILYLENKAVFNGIKNIEIVSYPQDERLFENNPYDGVCFFNICLGQINDIYLSSKGIPRLSEIFFESQNNVGN